MAVSVDQFGKSLVASGLMTAEEVKASWNAIPTEGRPKDGDGFAQLLIDSKKLTPFQAAELLAGRGARLMMGDYTIVAQIGAGGMGQVYKAQHRRMKRIVALKVMSSAAMKDAAAVKRFQREVEAAARLEHPNIVTAYDSGEAGSVKYLVMQFVDGGDLSDLIKKGGPLPLTTAVDYVIQAARGLAFAHGKGVVHRDIKPANLLLNKEGVVKILDMGLARIEDGDGLTATEQVMGTVDYMSPEQAADTKSAEGRSDIYSLGCTLWYLLTAKRLYDGDTMISRLMKHRDAPLPSLVKERDDATWPLEQVFHKMIAKRAADRYQTMDEVITALEPHGGGSSGGMGSSIGGGKAQSAELASFMKAMTGGAGKPAVQAPAAQPATSPQVDATAAFTAPEAGTDPKSELLRKAAPVGSASSSVLRVPVTKAKSGKNPPIKLIAAGAAGFLFLLLGVILVIKNDKGETVAEVKVADGNAVEVKPPAGGSVQVKPDDTLAKNNPQQPVPPKTIPPKTTPPANTTVAVAANTTAPPLAKAPFDAAQAKAHQQAWAKHLGTQVETVNSVGAKMVLIPPGEFMMGSTDAQIAAAQAMIDANGADSRMIERIAMAERPQHRVVLSKPIHVSAIEVTVGQFRQFVLATKYMTETEQFGYGNSSNTAADPKLSEEMKKLSWHSPGYQVTDDSPVSQITWNDAVAYCRWLTTQENKTYRLATEAEWEFACRAGTTTHFSFGDDTSLLEQYGWYQKNFRPTPQPVAKKLPNAFGLFDMHGNLQEWCADGYDLRWYALSPTLDPTVAANNLQRVLRGGLRQVSALRCRSAFRGEGPATLRDVNLGFRVVAELPVKSTLRNTATSNLGNQPPSNSTIEWHGWPAGEPKPSIAPFDAAQAKAHQAAWAKHLGTTVEKTIDLPGGEKMTFVLIPPGEFSMGSSDNDRALFLAKAANLKIAPPLIRSEGPQHSVRISRAFYLSANEVTQRQWQAVMGTTPWRSNPDHRDVAENAAGCVTWEDAGKFCLLASKSGLRLRLPTEAEWEYACRAGTTTAYSFGNWDVTQSEPAGIQDHVWFYRNTRTLGNKYAHRVGQKLSNGWGLFDMHGNVWEWCSDWYGDDYYAVSPNTDPIGPSLGSLRVSRGGAWGYEADFARSGFRYGQPPDAQKAAGVGFRVAMMIDAAKFTTAPSKATPQPTEPGTK